MKHIAMIRRLKLMVVLLGIAALAACQKQSANVNVHGVNYTEAPFFYHLFDPTKPDDTGAGEMLDPFAAGGTTCCFTLPRKWRPGIQAKVNATHWLPARADGSLPEVKETFTVEIPPYPDNTPGEIWVLRNTDGSVSVVSSDLQPDHAQWPGKVKGWPVPSLAYRRERWELHRQHEADGVELYLNLLSELEQNPEKGTNEAWEFAAEYHPDEIRQFSGPSDPKYIASLKQDYEEGLNRSRKLLKNVMDARP